MSGRGSGEAGRQWRERLARYSRAGGTIGAFCRRESVSTASFFYWRKRLAQEASSPAPTAPAFLPVVLPAAGPARIEIELPSGAVVRLASGDHAALRIAIDAAGRLPERSNGEARSC